MTTVFGEGRRFQATIPERMGDSRVLVDDVDVTRVVSGFQFNGWGGGGDQPPGTELTVTLSLPMVQATAIDAHNVTVVLAPHVAEVLLDAGWVPPDAAGQLLAVVDVARAWRHEKAFATDLADAVDTYEGNADG